MRASSHEWIEVSTARLLMTIKFKLNTVGCANITFSVSRSSLDTQQFFCVMTCTEWQQGYQCKLERKNRIKFEANIEDYWNEIRKIKIVSNGSEN